MEYHRHDTATHCRALWDKLRLLAEEEGFRVLFGASMNSMGVKPNDILKYSGQRNQYTFAVGPNWHLKAEPVVQVKYSEAAVVVSTL